MLKTILCILGEILFYVWILSFIPATLIGVATGSFWVLLYCSSHVLAFIIFNHLERYAEKPKNFLEDETQHAIIKLNYLRLKFKNLDELKTDYSEETNFK